MNLDTQLQEHRNRISVVAGLDPQDPRSAQASYVDELSNNNGSFKARLRQFGAEKAGRLVVLKSKAIPTVVVSQFVDQEEVMSARFSSFAENHLWPNRTFKMRSPLP